MKIKTNYRELLSTKALELCKEDIERHEGYVDSVYLDSEGLKTFGIGHLVKETEPEWDYKVGTPVSDDRVITAFERDFEDAIASALAIIPRLGDHPSLVQRIFINMAFNLGYNRLKKFVKTIRAIENRDYNKAADEMVDSKWYRQVRSRGVQLVSWMRKAAKEEEVNSTWLS